MRVQILGTAFLCALAAAGTAQTTVNRGIPPQRDAIPALPRATGHGSWRAQRRSYGFLEASEVVQPTRIPAKGLGLPPESLSGPNHPASPRRPLSFGPDPLFQPSGTNGPPLVDDLSSPAPSQPVMQDFQGIGENGESRACPDLAAGFDYVVTATSDDFATYDRAGNELFRADIHDFLGFSTDYEMFQPRVLFDPWYGRWVMMYHKERWSTEESSICVVISENSTPFGLGNAWYYDISAVQTGASGKAFADAFTLGYSNDYLTLGGNMHYFAGGYLWSRIWILDKAAAYSASVMSSVRLSDLTNPDGTKTLSPCASKMQTAWGEGPNIDGTWINSRGEGNMVTHWKMQDAFGANTLTSVDIGVSDYTYPPPFATQPDGSQLHVLDCRIMQAVTTLDTLGSNGVETFTSFNVDRLGSVGCFFLKIDPVLNVKEWDANFGSSGYDYFYSSPTADFSGSAVFVFSRTASIAGNEPEIRLVDYDRGVFSSSSAQLRDGDGCYDGIMWGPYSGGQVDWGDFSANSAVPGNPTKLWIYSMYGKTDSWGTYIGATSVWDQGNFYAVSPPTTWTMSGPVGGPFTNGTRQYTLMNSGDVGTVYEVTSMPSWLDADKVLGQLFPSNALVTFSLNSTADWLSAGYYTGDIVFQDVFNGGNTISRPVELTVQGAGIAYCTGDVGEGTPCPCNNDNNGELPDAGCANGAFASGAKMIATGAASVSNDTLTLITTNVHPSNSGLYFQANNAINSGAGSTFGDGLRCAGGGLIRLQVRFSNSQGVSQTTISIAAKGAVSAGDVKRYQCWYRDTSGDQPCGVGVNDFNLSNGLRVSWKP